MRARPPAPLAVRGAVGWLLGLVLSATAGIAPGAAAGSPVSLRVVGGTSVAGISSFPFQVALFIQAPGGGPGLFGQPAALAFCGGVIIDPIQVVTAAHCVTNELTGQPVSPANVTVLAGTATLPAAVPSQPTASAIAVDPQYDPQTADYDVAVVTLPTPLYAGSPRADGAVAVAPIPLITPALAARVADPNLDPPPPAVISGWGETSPLPVGAHDTSPNLPNQLQAVRTHLVADAACSSAYRGLGGVGVPAITPHMLCAGEPGGGVDACAGDSGGPLVVDIDNPASPPADYVLAGMIDFGAGCAQPGYPGVYVRLATPEIAGFISRQALAGGQQLAPVPAPVGLAPARRVVPGSGTASLAAATVRVRRRVALVAVSCATSACTGTLTLSTTTTVGIAHFSIAAQSTARVAVRITPRGQQQLDRHGHRLRTRATLHTSGSKKTRRALTLTD